VYLGYEQLCDAPLEGFTRLFSILDIEADPAVAAAFYSGADRRDAEGYDPALHDRCRAIHARLVERHLGTGAS